VPVRPRVLILDFGSQYTHLITRRVRELGVYGEALPCWAKEADAPTREDGLAGIVLSGGPSSVYDEGAPQVADWMLARGVPVLGVCYGLQALAWKLAGSEAVARGARGGEYGHATIERVDPAGAGESPLFRGVARSTSVWMSHGDGVATLPPGFRHVARSATCPLAAVEDRARALYGIQFHPEVTHTPEGRTILSNFLFAICGAAKSWEMGSFLEEAKRRIREQVGRGRVILGLSGGVDSSVAAVLLHEAIGDQLTCVFVDSGLLRAGEAEEVVRTFRDHFHLDLRAVGAGDRFLAALKGVADPEQKRRIIGRVFVEVFEAEARQLGPPGAVEFLAQGTLYPDVIESVSPRGGPSHTIKTHHNVGGLPEKLGLKLVEPLRELFKDEVRELGRRLGVPARILGRHPFPGPGLAVRCLGALDPESLDLLRAADAIAREELERSGWMARTSQAFVVLLPVRSVGVQGDARTYGRVAVLRVVETEDFMTAGWARLPHELLAVIASRITNEVRGINRVVYDVTSKPPATIEWE